MSYLLLILIVLTPFVSTADPTFQYAVSARQVTFTSLTEGSAYLWNFGNGQTSRVGPKVTFLYGTGGNYTVTLTVTDSAGRKSSVRQVISVPNNLLPFCEFSFSTRGVNLIVDAGEGSYDPDGTIVSYKWNFGDTTQNYAYPASTPTAEYTYASVAKSYVVTLTVTDDSGASMTSRRSITVVPLPVARFFYLYVGNKVTFSSLLSSPATLGSKITLMYWDFGDGRTLNTSDPLVSHFYPRADVWNVTLIVLDSTDQVSPPTQITIRSPYNAPPEARMTVLNYTASDQITIDPTRSYDYDGFITRLIVDFGDGSVKDYSSNDGNQRLELQKLNYTYTRGGVYVLKMWVYDNSGAVDSCDATTLVNIPPVATFSAQNLSRTSLTLDASQSYDVDGQISFFTWDFGDFVAPPVRTTSKLLTHQFPKAGFYNVTLHVTDNMGAASKLFWRYILVNEPPIAVIEVSSIQNDTIIVNPALSSDVDGNLERVEWFFGEEGTVIVAKDLTPRLVHENAVSHTYRLGGYYNVSLIVYDNFGYASSNVSKTIFVNSIPEASYVATFLGPNNTYSFDARQSMDVDGKVAQYTWTFQGETYPSTFFSTLNKSSATAFNHTFARGGDYSISLVVTDNLGAPSSPFVRDYRINTPPIAAFGVVSIEQDTVKLDYRGSIDPDGEISRLLFDFGNGQASRVVYLDAPAEPLAYTYQWGGFYNITLTVFDNMNASSSADYTQEVFVNTPPNASFEVVANLDGNLSLDAGSSSDVDGTLERYQWSFGDGSLAQNTTQPHITHHYHTRGHYLVTLTVYDNLGGSSVVTHMILVNTAPLASFAVVQAIDDWIIVDAQAYIDHALQATLNSRDVDGGFLQQLTWNFGEKSNPANFSNSTYSTQTYQYSRCGNYTITLFAADDDNYTSTPTQKNVFVNRRPTAYFDYTLKNHASPVMVVFNATDSHDFDGYVVKYCWRFGSEGEAEESCGDSAIVERSFPASTLEVVTVELSVIDDCSGRSLESYKRAIDLTEKAVYDLQVLGSFETRVLVTAVPLTNPSLARQSIRGLIWQFNSVNVSTPPNILAESFEFSQCGMQNIALYIQEEGDKVTKQSHIDNFYVNAKPFASFTFNKVNLNPFDWVFDASSSTDADGTIVKYCWKFGDGQEDESTCFDTPRTVHTFASLGSFRVSLTVQDSCNLNSTNIFWQNVTCQVVAQDDSSAGLPPPNAHFIITDRSPSKGEITFYTNSTYSYNHQPYTLIESYLWDFGDNATVKTMNKDRLNVSQVAHTFPTTGNYSVSLTIRFNTGGTITNTYTVFAIYQVGALPDAQNVDSPRFGITNGLVSGSHVLGGDNGGKDQQNATFDVWVHPKSDQVSLRVKNLDSYHGANTSYVWRLGDGNLAAGSTVTYSYGMGGDYNVDLLATDASGYTTTSSQSISVPWVPVPIFTATGVSELSLTRTLDGSFSRVSDHHSDNAPGCSWYLEGQDPSHLSDSCVFDYTFASPGPHSVTLRVTDVSTGLASKLTKNIQVGVYSKLNLLLQVYPSQFPFADEQITIQHVQSESFLNLLEENYLAPSSLAYLMPSYVEDHGWSIMSGSTFLCVSAAKQVVGRKYPCYFKIYTIRNVYLLLDTLSEQYIGVLNQKLHLFDGPEESAYWAFAPRSF